MPVYRILVTAIDSTGHINAVLGLGEALKAAGHKVYFAQREKHRNLAVKRGFQFIPFDETICQQLDHVILKWVDALAACCKQSPLNRYIETSQADKDGHEAHGRCLMTINEALGKVLSDKNNKFDAVIGDLPAPFSSLHKSSIPWFPLLSLSSLILHPSGPPFSSGYSIYSDKSKWIEFRKAYRDAHSTITKLVQDNLDSAGLQHIKFNPDLFYDNPQSIGFYHYPADLDFTECQPRLPNWHRIDCLIRQPDRDTEFVIPDNLKDKPGKLIYFSCGTLGSADLIMMNKFINILSKSPHRFIVSKGPRGDQLKLADNMWGENYVNQIEVLQNVDLVITHGGNNTFIETLYYGKPMIVIPYFYDQFDNAQRVVDKKIGFRINLYDLDEDYFLNCIENVLNDSEMQNRVKKISENMRKSNSLSEAVKLIEQQIERRR